MITMLSSCGFTNTASYHYSKYDSDNENAMLAMETCKQNDKEQPIKCLTDKYNSGIINQMFTLKSNERITDTNIRDGDCSIIASKYEHQQNDSMPMTITAQCEYDLYESGLKPDGKGLSYIDYDNADRFDISSAERGYINY